MQTCFAGRACQKSNVASIVTCEVSSRLTCQCEPILMVASGRTCPSGKEGEAVRCWGRILPWNGKKVTYQNENIANKAILNSDIRL